LIDEQARRHLLRVKATPDARWRPSS
jgi:hypothetical protein